MNEILDPLVSKVEKLEEEIGDVEKYDFTKYVEDVKPLEEELAEVTNDLKELEAQVAELNQIRGKLEVLRKQFSKLENISKSKRKSKIINKEKMNWTRDETCLRIS